MSEDQVSQDGSIKTVSVPQKLLPVESAMLAVIDYLTENDPRQPVIDGYSLVRQMDPDIRVRSHSGFSTFYRSLQRLSEWGYLASRREMLPMGRYDSGQMTTKTLYWVTDAGTNRLRQEANTSQ